jgi:hypothetical protein
MALTTPTTECVFIAEPESLPAPDSEPEQRPEPAPEAEPAVVIL